ncbi:hypothetical protein KEJ18_03550 [Candidatus Bathyarchaeota archaeon]|nr:hypothetical protein [Candidatus Bathyarchaeota archaeon]
MDMVTIILDVGNCLFFFGGFPQLIKTIKNRKTLKDLSVLTFFLYMVATILFVVIGAMLGSWMTLIFNSVNACYFCTIIYWVKKAERRTKGTSTDNSYFDVDPPA